MRMYSGKGRKQTKKRRNTDGHRKFQKRKRIHSNRSENNADERHRDKEAEPEKSLGLERKLKEEFKNESSDDDTENHMKTLLQTLKGTKQSSNCFYDNKTSTKKSSKFAVDVKSKSEDDLEFSNNDETDTENSVAQFSDDNEQENVKEKFAGTTKSCNTDEEDVEDAEDMESADEDDSESSGSRDPFFLHLHYNLSDKLYESVSKTPQETNTHTMKWPILGNLICKIPQISENLQSSEPPKLQMSILDNKEFAAERSLPKLISNINWTNLYVKPQIQRNLLATDYKDTEKDFKVDLTKLDFKLTDLQKEIFSILNNYQDFYYPERTHSNAEEIRFIYSLHAVNHLLKTRSKILRHNRKLQLRSKQSKNTTYINDDEFRDQGLVRPKVLFIVPFRDSCFEIVKCLIKILIGEDKGGSVINKKRFLEDFEGPPPVPRRKPKPEDYELTFKGNTDDTFKIGMAITKKTLKLYTDFYNSDIIISSVLGLRMLIGAEGEAERSYDFLASIELLIIDQADLLLMQNWDHMLHVLNHLHLQPQEAHGVDFSRLRSWCAEGRSKYYRQSLIFSSIHVPEIYSIFEKKCFNYGGKVKVISPILSGSICEVFVKVPLIFQKFQASSHSQAVENRMKFFTTKILPQYKDQIMGHTLIYIPSYFDFVQLRNYFKQDGLSFVQICEYSKQGKVARARDMFFHSSAHFLLYSERFHFFRRVKIKGIRHIIFYSPPTFPGLYSEMCNFMRESEQNARAGSVSNMTVTTIYCKYDILRLGAIVGTERAARMIKAEKSIHMLMTGE